MKGKWTEGGSGGRRQLVQFVVLTRHPQLQRLSCDPTSLSSAEAWMLQDALWGPHTLTCLPLSLPALHMQAWMLLVTRILTNRNQEVFVPLCLRCWQEGRGVLQGE